MNKGDMLMTTDTTLQTIMPAIEISPDGEPIFVLPNDLAANDMVEVHVGDHTADVIIDGRLLFTTRQLTNTLRSWLVMAEEVGLRPANCDDFEATYAPVYNCESKVLRQRRI